MVAQGAAQRRVLKDLSLSDTIKHVARWALKI
jgi:hypothetical protein